jgi:hypothetical protein
MSGRINHSRLQQRDRMREHGVEDARGGLPAGLGALPKPRPTKAALRAEIEAATACITRTIECACGHTGKAVIPPAQANRPLRCSRCGAVQTYPRQ